MFPQAGSSPESPMSDRRQYQPASRSGCHPGTRTPAPGPATPSQRSLPQASRGFWSGQEAQHHSRAVRLVPPALLLKESSRRDIFPIELFLREWKGRRERDERERTSVRETQGLVASQMEPDQGRGLNLQPQDVSLTGN
uniref:Uncharacterized protein n=1 Tax=Myotis myotis TaxID=51298 RepID=A0A7J7U5B0_MYOMY|nr:hypothetical protein mMyoMyo1_008814 [Myotis myotis]